MTNGHIPLKNLNKFEIKFEFIEQPANADGAQQ
jgi:hypothetical protein